MTSSTVYFEQKKLQECPCNLRLCDFANSFGPLVCEMEKKHCRFFFTKCCTVQPTTIHRASREFCCSLHFAELCVTLNGLYPDIRTYDHSPSDLENLELESWTSQIRTWKYCNFLGCTHIEMKGLPSFRVCAACQGPRYCSRQCQINDWRTHKQVCKKSISHAGHELELTSPTFLHDLYLAMQRFWKITIRCPKSFFKSDPKKSHWRAGESEWKEPSRKSDRNGIFATRHFKVGEVVLREEVFSFKKENTHHAVCFILSDPAFKERWRTLVNVEKSKECMHYVQKFRPYGDRLFPLEDIMLAKEILMKVAFHVDDIQMYVLAAYASQINHSKRSNVVVGLTSNRKYLEVRTTRKIKEGEELTLFYSTSFENSGEYQFCRLPRKLETQKDFCDLAKYKLHSNMQL